MWFSVCQKDLQGLLGKEQRIRYVIVGCNVTMTFLHCSDSAFLYFHSTHNAL